jgi:drug/metabolite transporter (DMT)-like permease
VFLGERLSRWMWAGLAVLLAGVRLSTSLGLVRFDEGTVLIGVSTMLFSVGFVVTKHLFQGSLNTMVAMTAQLGICCKHVHRD